MGAGGTRGFAPAASGATFQCLQDVSIIKVVDALPCRMNLRPGKLKGIWMGGRGMQHDPMAGLFRNGGPCAAVFVDQSTRSVARRALRDDAVELSDNNPSLATKGRQEARKSASTGEEVHHVPQDLAADQRLVAV
jgi:hypothetical protein